MEKVTGLKYIEKIGTGWSSKSFDIENDEFEFSTIFLDDKEATSNKKRKTKDNKDIKEVN